MEENDSKIKETAKNDTSCQSAGPSETNKTDTVPKMLIEDYTFDQEPESLQNILKFFENHATTSKSKENISRIEILAGIIYVLMLEYGFVPTECRDIHSFDFNYKQVLELSKNVPMTCHNKVYTLVMCLQPFSMYEVKLAIFSCSEDLLLNCFVKGVENGTYNLMVDPLKYFISSKVDLRCVKFQYLDHLSRTFKNNIAFPVKYVILKQNEIIFPCLEDLPSEVLIMIMRKLQICYLMPFGHSHNRFFHLMRDMLVKIRLRAKANFATVS